MKIPWAIDMKTGEWLRADRAVHRAERGRYRCADEQCNRELMLPEASEVANTSSTFGTVAQMAVHSAITARVFITRRFASWLFAFLKQWLERCQCPCSSFPHRAAPD